MDGPSAPGTPWWLILFLPLPLLLFPAFLLYGVCLPLLYLSEWLHPHVGPLPTPPVVLNTKADDVADGATSCNATGYDKHYRCLRDDCAGNALHHWRACPTTGSLPRDLPHYSHAQQAANLRALLRWNLCSSWFRWFPGFRDVLRLQGLKTWHTLMRIPTCDPQQILDFYDDVAAATRAFVASAEARDAGMDSTALFGAVRLLWFITAFEAVRGRPVIVDPALQAYCLIYPLTDNYLDDTTLTPEAKHAFNRRLREWIQVGLPDVLPSHPTERRVCGLLRTMAARWPPRQYRGVRYALNAIHAAQTQSVLQCGGLGKCSAEFLEEVSAMKGGASLVAAGYLIEGDVAPRELQYLQYLGLGFQLLDDFQDALADLLEGRCTLVTDHLHHRRPLDACVTQLLHYIAQPQALGPTASRDCGGGLGDYVRLVLVRVTTLLTLEAVALLPDALTPAFRARLEALSPIPLEALKALRFEARLYDVMLSAAI